MNPYLKSFPHRRRVLKGYKIPHNNYKDIPEDLYWDFIGENGFIGHQTFLYKPYRPTVREGFKGSSSPEFAIKTDTESIVSKPRAFSLNLIKPKTDNIPV